jgi:hypothetical protein
VLTFIHVENDLSGMMSVTSHAIVKLDLERGVWKLFLDIPKFHAEKVRGCGLVSG